MAKAKILFAEPDERYLTPLEHKFIKELGEQMELIVITDPEYLDHYFEEPKKLDLLIINESLYNYNFEKHNIKHTFLLTEEELQAQNTEDLNQLKIYKYTSVDSIFRQVIRTASIDLNYGREEQESAKLIAVYSAVGGIGKTTVSLGLCQALAKNGKKVLFIGTDSLQTFGHFLPEQRKLNSHIEKQFTEKSSYIYSEIREHLIQGPFDVLPLLSKVRPSLGIKAEHYHFLLERIKEAGEYEYLILDLATDFSSLTADILGLCDKNIILMGQDANSVYKSKRLLENIDCSDGSRFIGVCNRYRAREENHLLKEEIISQCSITAQIRYDSSIPEMDVEALGRLTAMEELAIFFM